ncbi:phage minor capsid protein [Enterocloster sp.]|uniref:phage minor capsid protein n=1 Tax=Enterocloster sp. TaxID=2719315 RepID=UPI003080141C
MRMNEYDITTAFKVIENELIASMIRNMDRHRAEETKEGYEWSMWQTEQLKALEKYKWDNQKKYRKQFQKINGEIDLLIRKARETGNMQQEIKILEAIKKGFPAKKISKGMAGEFFRLNDRKLEALIEATTHDMEKAETAILRKAEDDYRQAIYNAQVYANTGAGTYEKAVDMATKDMLSRGINCVQYINGARHTLADYADMAIRTASKRAYLQGEGEKRQEWGIATVIMAKRGNPCPKCLPFVGKVLIDDVWSGGSEDGVDPETGKKYPLMSYAISCGLYHPRCKDSHTTYFPGISTADDTWTKEELEAIGQEYEAEQKQQYAKRQEEKYGRLAEYSLDAENQKKYAEKQAQWKQQHPQGWRRQFMRNGSAEPEKTWREKYNETVEKEAILKDRLDQLNQESRKWEEKYFETMDEEYAQKSLSNDPEIEDITKKLDKIQEEKKTYVKIRLTEAEKSMAEAGIAETVKLSEKMTVESIDILENSLREMVVDNRLPSLKGVRYDPSFINLYGGKDTVALYNWGDETMYIGEMLSDPDAYKQHRLLAERSYKKQRNEYEPTWRSTIDSLEKEIPEEDDSGRKKYLIKNRNDVLSGLISQRRLVAEDAKDAIIHEYGHHVHNKASSESNIFGSKELKSRKFAGSYEWGGVHEGKVTAAQVSDYAAESPLEAFAESFTAYVKGEDIPESLKSVVEGAIEKTGGKLKQPVVKVPDSGIIKSKIANEEISVTKIQNLGKINTKVLEKEFGKIQTDDIIVTNERIDHIKERHPEDYDLFEKYGRESVSDPDLIIKDIKNKGTVFMIKKLPETNLNVVVRVVLETDDSKLKNSVMTFYRIRERNLKKLIEKNGMLYKKE